MDTKKKIVFHNDAGHGWYAVKRKELAELGILNKISGFSYQSRGGQTVYLEEDCDASIYFDKAELTSENTEVKNSYRAYSHIRSLDSFTI